MKPPKTKGKKMKSIKEQIEEQVVKADESPNYAIEELTDALDTAAAIVYPDWNVMGDGWNGVSVWKSETRKSVEVLKSETHVGTLIVVMWYKGDIAFKTKLKADENVIAYAVIPMIEQYLQGDRADVKKALSPLLEISPAIN